MSLVWGFAAKSHIDSVFSKQKSGIRAVMAGVVNLKYRGGIIPSHANSSWSLFPTLIFYKDPLLAFSTHNEDLVGPACLLTINCCKNIVNILMLAFQQKETMSNGLFFY